MECIEYRRIERDGIAWDVSVLSDDEQPELDLWDVTPEYEQEYRKLLDMGALRMVGVRVQAIYAPGITDDLWGLEYGAVPDNDDPTNRDLVQVYTLGRYLTESYMTMDGKDITLIDSLIDTALGQVNGDTIAQLRAIADVLSARLAANE